MDRIDAAGFANKITDMVLRYPINIVAGQLNLLDSHDVGVIVNNGNSSCEINMENVQILMAHNIENNQLNSYGYVIFIKKKS